MLIRLCSLKYEEKYQRTRTHTFRLSGRHFIFVPWITKQAIRCDSKALWWERAVVKNIGHFHFTPRHQNKCFNCISMSCYRQTKKTDTKTLWCLGAACFYSSSCYPPPLPPNIVSSIYILFQGFIYTTRNGGDVQNSPSMAFLKSLIAERC